MQSIPRCLIVLAFLLCTSHSASAAPAGVPAARTASPPAAAKPADNLAPAAQKPVVTSPAAIALQPDLTMDPLPPIGPFQGGQKIETFTVTIKNLGPGTSPATELKVICAVLDGGENGLCPAGLSGSRPIPSLAPQGKPGDMTTVVWPAASNAKWMGGKYRLTFELDPARMIRESNKGNNTRIVEIVVSSAATPVARTAETALVSQQMRKLEKVRGTIKGKPGGKNPAQWFDGKCDNLHIELLDENSVVTAVVHATPDGEGCRFEAIAPTPKSLKVQAPATYGKNEFTWQYYQQWSSSDATNTTNLILKEAGPKKVQMVVTMPDIKIKSVKTYPMHPTDVERVDIIASVENKGGLPGKKKLYYKCIPQSTPTCGGNPENSKLQSSDVELGGGNEIEKPLFNTGATMLWRLEPGQYEIAAGFSQGLADNTVVRRKFTVDKKPLTVYETSPRSLTAGEHVYDSIQVSGAKFTTQSTILMQPPGTDGKIPLATHVPSGTNQSKPSALAGKLPFGYPIGSQPGDFYFWVKNPDGEMSNEAKLTVKPPYTGPPVIKDYYPRVIKKWDYDPYNSKMSIPMEFRGEGLQGKQVKTTAAIVESSTNVGPLTLNLDSSTSGKLVMPSNSYLKKGAIEVVIYNGDPANSTKVRIPVDMDMPVLDTPVIVSPADGEIFFSRDITLRIEPPAGTTSKKFKLRWWFKPSYVTDNYDEIYIMADVDLSGAGTQGIKLPKSLFSGEGEYRVDARVAETEGSPSSNGTTKWVNFKVIHH